MRLFPFSQPKKFYLLRFEQDQPIWELSAGNEFVPIEFPPPKNGLPILAVIPDRYFFFYLPGKQQGTRRKNLHQAVQLQIKHLFPPPGPGEETQVLDTGQDVLAAFYGPKLQSFVHRHRDLLTQANIVTTPFLMARALMYKVPTPSWSMHNPGDPILLLTNNTVHSIFGNEQELERRMKTLHCDPPPVHLKLPELLLDLSHASIPWNRFRIQLPDVNNGPKHPRIFFNAAIALLIVGFLFCCGELLNMRSAQRDKKQWEQTLDTLYTQTLGPEYGSDPYGLLLYRAEQFRDQENQGLDVLDFLGRLSQAAPQGLRIHGLSLGIDSGTVQASLDSYEFMDKFIQDLQSIQAYDFSLHQADSTEDRVQITLRVEIKGLN
ncbi:MAG: hypothetical protein U5L00_21370 [Desulfovermiculus sp.]|nr:hypothetical protein [Desulfovermiculus sp.]